MPLKANLDATLARNYLLYFNIKILCPYFVTLNNKDVSYLGEQKQGPVSQDKGLYLDKLTQISLLLHT